MPLRSIAVLIAALVPASAYAATVPAPAFENTLGRFESHVVAAAAARQKSSAESLQAETKAARTVALQAWQLRSFLSSLRSRAAASPRDPSLFGDLSVLLRNLDVWLSNMREVDGALSETAATISRDPALAMPARLLERQAALADSESGYLRIEARNALVELSSAGYGGQAYQIQQYAAAGARAGVSIHAAARRIVEEVGQP